MARFRSLAPSLWPEVSDRIRLCHRNAAEMRVRTIFAFVSAAHGQVSLSFMGIPPTIQVANIGMADSLIIMVMALVALVRGGFRRSGVRSAS